MALLSRLFGGIRQQAACGRCNRPVRRVHIITPMWYGADEVDWHCTACDADFCGTCCTPKLQTLKSRYGTKGYKLKHAMDDDPGSDQTDDEMAPQCPRCHQAATLVTAGEA